MFEMLRIKQHMVVADASGRQRGAVDDYRIKLPRSESINGSQHYVPVDNVAKIADHRVCLKQSSASAIR